MTGEAALAAATHASFRVLGFGSACSRFGVFRSARVRQLRCHYCWFGVGSWHANTQPAFGTLFARIICSCWITVTLTSTSPVGIRLCASLCMPRFSYSNRRNSTSKLKIGVIFSVDLSQSAARKVGVEAIMPVL